jgi:hypothetical protein
LRSLRALREKGLAFTYAEFLMEDQDLYLL